MFYTLMSTGGVIALIAVALVLVIVFWYIGTMNRLRQIDLKVQEAESGIDVALTKRFDTLTKLLEILLKIIVVSNLQKFLILFLRNLEN